MTEPRNDSEPQVPEQTTELTELTEPTAKEGLVSRSWIVGMADDGERVEKVMARALRPHASRAWVRGLLQDRHVRVQNRVVAKGDRVRAGQVVSALELPRSWGALAASDMRLSVALEREDLVIVDKEAGLATVALGPGASNTLVSHLLARYPAMADIGYNRLEPGIVHRLDVDTSGLLLAARTRKAFAHLVQALREGRLRKEYLLLCCSDGLAASGQIDVPLGVRTRRASKVVVHENGRGARLRTVWQAQTTYEVLCRRRGVALVLARAPKAVRHQVRAHFAAIGHPLLGDQAYGGDLKLMRRQALHASRICFDGNDEVAGFDVCSDLPEDMARVIDTGDSAKRAGFDTGEGTREKRQ